MNNDILKNKFNKYKESVENGEMSLEDAMTLMIKARNRESKESVATLSSMGSNKSLVTGIVDNKVTAQVCKASGPTEKELIRLKNVSNQHYEKYKNGEMTFEESCLGAVKDNKESIQRVNMLNKAFNDLH